MKERTNGKMLRIFAAFLTLALIFSSVSFSSLAEFEGEDGTTADPDAETSAVSEEGTTHGETTSAATTTGVTTTAAPTTTEKPTLTRANPRITDPTKAPETTVEQTTQDAQLVSLQNEYEKLEKELAANQDKLSDVKSDISDQKSVVSAIYSNISTTQAQINVLSTRINLLNSDISSANNTIESLENEIVSIEDAMVLTQGMVEEKAKEKEETYEMLKQRLRAMYMSGSSSNIEFLISSDSFSTLLTRTELVRRVAEHDNDLMEVMAQEIESLKELQTTLETQKTTAQQKKEELSVTKAQLVEKKNDNQVTASSLESKRSSIAQQYEQANAELAKLDKTSAEYKAIISKQEDEMEQLSKEMEGFIKGVGSSTGDMSIVDDSESPYVSESTSVSSEGMIWPVTGCSTRISSPYGYRTHPITGEYKFHSGIDITGGSINGKPIVAARNGTVIYAAWKGGYGNYVVIDHGNGITTCYGHASTLLVSNGQKVKQGQQVALVGSTGNSTGPHLHFEVRINGTTTAPLNYVKLPA